jgi:hypothetical protein
VARFNSAPHLGVRSPIATIEAPARTALGARGVSRDQRSELFLLAVSNMSEPKGAFHEDGRARDERFTHLVRELSPDTDWITGFIGYLRGEANIRSASIVAAADAVHERLSRGIQGNRQIISAALQRADEPGEMLAYWFATYGRNVPKPVKRGIADALDRMWNERSYLKWDTDSKAFRFADVLQICHPKSEKQWQNALFKFSLDNRYGTNETPEILGMVRARKALMEMPVAARSEVTAGQLQEAGMTWESFAGWKQSAMDGPSWDKIIPSMGIFALVRNLRNFDQSKISRTSVRLIEDKLTDPDEIAKSRMFPMSFLNAYRAVDESDTVTAWGPILETALDLSLSNVPVLGGRTLILTDLSGSMYDHTLTEMSNLRWADAACIFGAALARRSEQVDLYGFGWETKPFQVRGSLLKLAKGMADVQVDGSRAGYIGQMFPGLGGTNTIQAIQNTYTGQDRIVLLTDEQYAPAWATNQGLPTWAAVDDALAATKAPVYVWNFAGYRAAQGRSGNRKRHTFGGLSDVSFRLIESIERGLSQNWPWERKDLQVH